MMTKEEIMKVLDAMNYAISPSGTFWVKKHNEAKQILQAALAAPEQEPVAVVELVHQPLRGNEHGSWHSPPQLEARLIRPVENGQRLFTHPSPQPVELSDDEIMDIGRDMMASPRWPAHDWPANPVETDCPVGIHRPAGCSVADFEKDKQMRASPTEVVEIACEVKRQTDKAWLVFDGAREVWIAKSQISDYVEEQGLIGTKVTSVFVPLWLAHEKGLI